MNGQPTRLPPGAPTRSARDLVAVFYRRAFLIVVCVLVGTAASLALYLRPPRVHASGAKIWVETEAPGSPSSLSGAPASREKASADADAPIEGVLKLDLNPDADVTGAALTPVVATLMVQTPEPPLRLDEARQSCTDAPERPPSGQTRKTVALLGPVAGLLLGLLLAALRELGGDRLRSSRDVEGALGAPVLGAIPTLSAKARSAYLGSSTAVRAATQLA